MQENSVKSKVKYFLWELYGEKKPITKLYASENYKQLLMSSLPFSDLFDIIEANSNPECRHYLRQIAIPYTQDYLVQSISVLDLDQISNPEILDKIIFYTALIYDPIFKLTEWQSFVTATVEELSLRFHQKVDFRLFTKKPTKLSAAFLARAYRILQTLFEIMAEYFLEKKYKPIRHGHYKEEAHYPHAFACGNRHFTPLSITLLYLRILLAFGFPVVAINMPRHFLLKVNVDWSDLIFDPFHNGMIRDREDLLRQLRSHGIPFHAHYFEPCSYEVILKRIVANLIAFYTKTNNKEKLAFLRSLSYSDHL
ncbi:MAG: hypothetical protein D6767_03480 [Candidatus Hydrogenedentota bacterium]|nr:MAG: hypothetical protein D6767_03480 [Candidatus Hydrogenedentota bacterium]